MLVCVGEEGRGGETWCVVGSNAGGGFSPRYGARQRNANHPPLPLSPNHAQRTS